MANLLELPAELIGLICSYRWTIETFCRFFKQMLGCTHLLWDDPRGIRLQAYWPLIAYLLIQKSSGRKPTTATFAMLIKDDWLRTPNLVPNRIGWKHY